MRGFLFTFSQLLVAAAICFPAAAQESAEGHERLDSVVVSASRAGSNTPVTFSMVGAEELRASNPVNSLPMTLGLLPSVVVSNEGGTGLGYSKLTVRGSKGSQINVTLNGITLNDGESQEVFWVNIPALTSILTSVQVQRGLGTSANGAGAFGASINMNTAFAGSEPHVRAEIGRGSYNTMVTTVSASTGILPNGLYFSGAYSRDYTDGYIRNAWAKVQSLFAVAGWLHGSNSLRLTYLMGDQHTGITWNGIDMDAYEKDRRYNDAGEWYDQYGNVHYYDNESDNYTQHHIQLNYTCQLQDSWVWTTTLNYTRGDGYNEYYKANKKFTKYGFPSGSTVETPNGSFPASTTSDFIVRKWMGNDYCVFNSEVKYDGSGLHFVGGVNASVYSGDHFGEIRWNQLFGDGYDYASRYPAGKNNDWYFNNGLKKELNVFGRAEYLLNDWITAYADLQYRGVSLVMDGVDDEDDLSLAYSSHWNFLNPRAGFTFAWTPGHKAYLSAAYGHREPGRSDIKEIIASNNLGGTSLELKPEKMLDVELGYEYSSEKFSGSANLYFMEYRDMLLETGRLSDSGYPIKDNVDRAYRRGLELSAAWQTAAWLRIDGNATVSANKIRKYNDSAACIDSFDNWNELGYSQVYATFDKTDILLSPSLVGMLQVSLTPFSGSSGSLRNTSLSLNGKYVGRQYLDNTSSAERSVPAYFVSNLALSHEWAISGGSVGVAAYVNNLFNRKYFADGGAWKYYSVADDAITGGVYIYPQATRNFMLKLTYSF